MEKKGRKEGTEAHRKRQSGTQKYSKQNIFLNKKKDWFWCTILFSFETKSKIIKQNKQKNPAISVSAVGLLQSLLSSASSLHPLFSVQIF